MEPSILVPHDGSRQAQSALTYASRMFSEETITALHTIEPFSALPDEERRARERYEGAYERTRNLLTEAPQEADANQLDITTEFISGHPVHAILRYASLYTFEQIVLERYDQAETADEPLDNVAEVVIRRADVPVTLVRSATDDIPVSPPESVLVPFDGSTPACAALEYAIETFPGATIHVLYVRYPSVDDVDQPGVRGSDYSAFEEWYEVIRDWHAQADRNPERILRIASDAAANIQTAVESRNPPSVILDYLDRIETNHVTIGSHSGDDGTRILLGSVAQLIVRQVSLPVTIVR